MRQVLTLFVSTFSTLLAIINPLEVLPVFIKLLEGEDADQHRHVARCSCFYAILLLFFFLVFGTLILKIFGVSLSMVRIVGGIILLRIGFELFSGSSADGSPNTVNRNGQKGDIAFVPLAMPPMCGPGAIATMLGMTSLVKSSGLELASFLAIACATLAAMLVTYLCLAYAENVVGRIGPMGIDAVTRIVGFFVATMGGALIFHGVVEALQEYGVIAAR
ncbi:MarC family protein [Microvirga massiliensis]|uniref:MarC family protein n=1 Tax=Microvirga massiliensis TaxID=1033741 RepID=UPI00062B38D2|nr:MarC family protein [Microvirga massiliensis]